MAAKARNPVWRAVTDRLYTLAKFLSGREAAHPNLLSLQV